MALALVVGTVAVVATQGDDEDPAADVSLAELEPALLTADDVGSQYTLDTSDDDDDDPLESDTMDASDECREALTAFEAGDVDREEITVAFSNDIDGSIDHTISLGQSGGPSLAAVRAAIDTCGTIGYSEDGTTGEFSFTTSDLDGIGDHAIGLAIDATVETQGFEFAFEMYGVLWERDGVHGTVTGFGGFDEASFDAVSMDRGVVEDLARTSDQRIAEVLTG